MAKTGQEKKKAVGMQVRLIRENKADLIKTIEPQVIHNRFDVKFEDYDLLSLSDDNGNGRSYVPIRNGGERLEVGLYLRDPEILRGGGVHALAAHLFEHYPCSKEVFFLHTYVPIPHIVPKAHWHVELPASIEEFDSTLHSKTRYNVKWYPKKIRKDLGDYSVDIFAAAECPERLVSKYLAWKKEAYGFNWDKDARCYLSQNGITHVYCMHTDREPLAIGFVCQTGENCFLENFAYNKDFSIYSPGMVLYHFIIADLIKKGKRKLFLLDGELDYKRRFNGIRTETWTGCIFRDEQKVFRARRIGACINQVRFLSGRSKKRIASFVSRLFLFDRYYEDKMKEAIC